MSDFILRAATPSDAAAIVALLKELADYEKILVHFFLTEELVRRDMFGQACHCDLAFDGDEAVAIAQNGVIGNAGAIPWHISADMKRFKALTLGHTVVMGRKTWDSLPRKPLPGRVNLVITRQADWQTEGAVTSTSLEDALAGITG